MTPRPRDPRPPSARTGRRGGARPPRARLIGLATAAALVLSGCPSGGQEAVDVPTPAPRTPTPAPVPTPGPGEADGMVIASPDGIHRVRPDGSPQQLTSTPAATAYPLGEDRVVFQELPDEGQPAQINIGVGTPFSSETTLLAPTEETVALLLHDVGVIDGRRSAVITEVTGDAPEEQTETLSVIDIASGERTDIAETGGWEDWTARATFGGGTFALFAVDAGAGYTTYLSVEGEAVEEAHDPLPEPCDREDDPSCPAGMVTDPGGRWFAWIAEDRRPEGDFFSRLIVTDRSDGTLALSVELPRGSGLSRLEVTEDKLVVNRWDAHASYPLEPVAPLLFRLDGNEGGTEPRALPLAGYGALDRER